MTLLAVERIKLFSTRSPWWCSVTALALTIGFAAMMGLSADEGITVDQALMGYQFGLMVVLVLAALAVTTEYRFGTIRATFQAAPNRVAVLVAKAGVVAALAFVVGEIASFGSWGVAQAFAAGPELAIDTAGEWRQIVGVGPLFALSAVLAVGVGALLRQSAGAVTLLIVWSLLVERLLGLVPNIGEDLVDWMPFVAASRFLQSDLMGGNSPLGPWASLAYFAVIAFAVLGVAAAVVHRRDA
ncbi:hypothetical protein [Saccharopolyspora gloriosae]|uniref:hypothetical protein n=1 Tax=Saccharopolyspora gloriosae TaxID=455344 RepID=UPI001FB7999B|nr:hypothetical protein [Saccharopolyspora gloriosae]